MPEVVITTQLARYFPFEEAVAQGFLLPDGSPNPALPVNTASQAAASYITAAYDPELKGTRLPCSPRRQHQC